MKFTMLLDQTRSEDAVLTLVHGGDATTEDMIRIGHLNFAAFVDGFEPPAALWNDSAILDPRILEWLRKTA